MLKLLHLSWEVPDIYNKNKTKAVKNLIKETENNFETEILSFNRCKKFAFSTFVSNENGHTAIKYFGLPYGLFHYSSIKCLFNKIKGKIEEFDLLHGHKLTFEGVLCYMAYKKIGKPYVITLRGDTDFKFIFWLPQCKFIFRKVVENAEKIFCLNPWSAKKLKEIFPSVANKIVVLPNICYVERFLSKGSFEVDVNNHKLQLVTTFNLDTFKRKRFELVLRVLSNLSIPSSLFVIGAGSPKAETHLKTLIKKYSVEDKVQLLGFKGHEELTKIYNKCDLFFLPSKRETFGMVYLEALACGLPVLQSEGVGLDGFFCDEPFFMTARTEEEFTKTIEDYYLKKSQVKIYLQKYLMDANLDKFKVKNIAANYISEIHSLCRK